ncbi:putative pre-16S rRNA nuclease [Alphaproteobacteria bacterium]
MLQPDYSEFIDIVMRKKQYKLLGLDVGSKMIGVALFNNLVLISIPMCTVKRTTPQQDVRSVIDIINTHQIDGIVVGMPFQMNGSIGTSAKVVIDFITVLRHAISISVVTHDERFTTALANTILKQINMPRIKRNKVDNEVAASLILDGFLIKLKEVTKSVY